MEQSDLNLLHTAPPSHLQSLVRARRLPLSLKGESGSSSEASSATIEEVAQHLFNPTTIGEAIHSLGEIERLILRELVACGGRANSRDLALYLTLVYPQGLPLPGTQRNPAKQTKPLPRGEPVEAVYLPSGTPGTIRSMPDVGILPPQYPTPHPHGVFEQALRRLLVLGLLFWGKQTNFAGGRDYASGVYDGVLIVPQAVMEVAINVGVPLVGTPDEGLGMRGKDREDIGEGMRALQRSLYLYWSLVASIRDGLQLVNKGLLSRPALRQVTEQLEPKMQGESVRPESESPRLLFLRLLLMKLGLLYERRGTLRTAPADAFFSLPLLERARRCYRLWLETPFWNELLYLPEVVVRPGPAPLDAAHEEVVRARQIVMERVLHEQPGVWRELPAFIARTKLYTPYLLFPRQYGPRADRYSVGSNPYGWDFRLRRGWLTHREGWHMVEGGFIRAVVLGPLRWLGLVEVNSEDNPIAFRLASGVSVVTSVGVPLAGTLGGGGRLIVQPNFELVALAPVSEALLVSLDRFAERLRLEHIAQYRLTRASVTRAIQMGLHIDTIAQALTQAAGGEIPQNVQYSLVEWERQARRVEMWQGATLLEVDDAALLDALFANEETRPLFGRRLAPLLAEIAPQRLSAVQEALWQRDYLPALTPAPMQNNLLEDGRLVMREAQWRLHDDGLLQPFYAVLDLYLAAEVARFSELDEMTGWRRITPSAMQRARNGGLSLEYIMRFLQHYCEDGVPASFLIRLKLWGGGYGEQYTISVEHSPLLRLSASVLQDLQADEELGPLLGTEVEQPSRLVHIAPEHLERVQELLRERGFEVE